MIGRILIAFSIAMAALVALPVAPSLAQDEPTTEETENPITLGSDDNWVTYGGDILYTAMGDGSQHPWRNNTFTVTCEGDDCTLVSNKPRILEQTVKFSRLNPEISAFDPEYGSQCLGNYVPNRTVNLTITAERITGTSARSARTTLCEGGTGFALLAVEGEIDLPVIAGNPCVIDNSLVGCQVEPPPVETPTTPTDEAALPGDETSEEDEANPLVPIIIGTLTGVAAIAAVAAAASQSAKNKARGAGRPSSSASNIASQVAAVAQGTGNFAGNVANSANITAKRTSNAPDISSSMKDIAESTANVAKDTAAFTADTGSTISEGAPSTNASTVTDAMKDIAETASNVAKDTANFASEASGTVAGTDSTPASQVADAMKGIAEQAANIGQDTANFVEGATDSVESTGSAGDSDQAVKDIASQLADAASDIGKAAGDQADNIIRPKE